MTGTAAILNFGYLDLVYELEDLSHGGAQLKGSQAVPRGIFEILLRVSGHYWERRARLAWDDSGDGGCLGIEFIGQDSPLALDWSLLPLVASSENEAWASQQLTRSALVILNQESRQSPDLFQSILALGLAPIVVSTPLEAITVLERGGAAIEVVFMTATLSGCRRGELAHFVSDTYPEIKLVVLETGINGRAHFQILRAKPTKASLGIRGLDFVGTLGELAAI